ncbi:short-chain dehydrogenase/reductase trope [Lipomyces kononenkoae]
MSEIESETIKGSLSAMRLDVTDEKSVKDAAEQVQQRVGRQDVLVNNAAVSGVGLDVKTSFQRCMETNVMGPALVSEVFRPLLFKSHNPYSVYVGSGARTLTRIASQLSVGHENIRGSGAYQVSKAALNMLALQDFRDNGANGLKVFVVSPGFVRSNLRGTSDEVRRGWGKAGDPEESGKIVLSVVQGKRDADVGCFIYKDGIHPW